MIRAPIVAGLLLSLVVAGPTADGKGPAPPGAPPYDEALARRLASALAARGAGYEPRTEHLDPDGSPRYTNRLILETSPYLLQHAHNPVDWYPWGDEAFQRARELGRPVILSIGYSTCHWCHVMERESFEDEAIARFMNENFISIKVDREERPDLDAVYMAAVRAMGLNGGWPMTTILTPDREPFFGGTYFPPRAGDRGATRGFWEILHELRDLYDSDREGVVARAATISRQIARSLQPLSPGDVPGAEAILSGVRALAHDFDPIHGGFGTGQKFPRPVSLELLLRYHRRTGDPQALKMVTFTLERMAAGGIQDQIGGGFHRYTVERTWLVPHFEKMLYDNAQLAVVYLEAFQLTGRRDFGGTARRTLDYVSREMTAPEGGFYSATDADSPSGEGHDEEGLFFTWTIEELNSALGKDLAAKVIAFYGVTPEGNFEGRNILHPVGPPDEFAAKSGEPVDRFVREIGQARGVLYETRAQRPPPLTDRKILTAWNGLMISAFSRGARILGEEKYTALATEAATFLLEKSRKKGRLYRTWADGRAGRPGVLSDYAFLAAGLLDLYEATFDPRWLTEAIALHEILSRHFEDPAGGFFMTPDDGERLIARDKPYYDGAEPAGNSVALLNLLRLHEFTGNEAYRTSAVRSLSAFSKVLSSGQAAAPLMLSALDFHLDRPKEVVLITPGSVDQAKPFLDVLARHFLPNHVVVSTVEGAPLDRLAAITPLVSDRVAKGGRATAYVCENRLCKLPTTDTEVFGEQISQVFPYEGIDPDPLQPSASPEPWSHDEANNRHWHPGHGHWHRGAPPPPGERDL